MAKTTPLDVFRPSVPRASKQQSDERMNVCRECDELHLGVCGVCKCVMKVKTTLGPAECPLGKW